MIVTYKKYITVLNNFDAMYNTKNKKKNSFKYSLEDIQRIIFKHYTGGLDSIVLENINLDRVLFKLHKKQNYKGEWVTDIKNLINFINTPIEKHRTYFDSFKCILND